MIRLRLEWACVANTLQTVCGAGDIRFPDRVPLGRFGCAKSKLTSSTSGKPSTSLFCALSIIF